MSFSYNPFKHLDVIEVGVNQWQASCSGCGARVGTIFDRNAPIGIFADAMDRHLRSSHEVTPEHVASWSVD